jgi:tRNA-specific 2-thiouridylase
MNSLGIAKPPNETRVVVAMSGGVDSSTVAALLAAEGYGVVGITLQLYEAREPAAQGKTCCAGQDIHDARRVAEALGIPHYLLDYVVRFRRDVMEQFAASYARGETPVPCVLCNRTVKFRDLMQVARDLGADALATGHYVRRVVGARGPELHRAADAARDQSYFLYATTREQLEFLRFPLGGMPKDQVRAAAARFALPVAAKPDSQDICFVPDGDYAKVVARLRPDAAAPGEIVDAEGRVLGRHDGIVHFTVGQRRGIGIASAEPLYVIALDPAQRRVVVGPKAALGARTVPLTDVNWLGGPIPAEGRAVTVKLRSAQPPAPATVLARENGIDVGLAERGHVAAPGQACAIYDGDRLLGGGTIMRPAAGEGLSPWGDGDSASAPPAAPALVRG